MRDANYTLTVNEIRAYGSQNGGSIIRRSEFERHLVQNRIELPKTKVTTGINIEFPFYFVSDAAVHLRDLRDNLMRSNLGILLAQNKEAFNERLSQ